MRAQATHHAVGEMVQRLFGGSPEGLVTSLVETRQIMAARRLELASSLEKERQ
jgi:hypothetical protein